MEAISTGTDVARMAYNALLWSSKKPPWDIAYVRLDHDGVTTITSDSYAATESWTEADTDVRPTDDGAVVVKVSRDELVELERLARMDLKNIVRLTFDLGESLTYSGMEGDYVMTDTFKAGTPDEESTDEVILWVFANALEDRIDEPHAYKFMIDPRFLRYFSMTKRMLPDTCADFWIGEEGSPVLIRVGRESRTVIMPVDRDRHEASNGQEVLW